MATAPAFAAFRACMNAPAAGLSAGWLNSHQPGSSTMNTQPSVTETVVRSHLQTFLDQKGTAAIVADYDEHACFFSEDKAYRGKAEIGAFFEEFIASLPPRAIPEFSLRSLRVEGDLAYITWSAGSQLPLGTDTFVVRNGKIVSQTFAMYTARTA